LRGLILFRPPKTLNTGDVYVVFEIYRLFVSLDRINYNFNTLIAFMQIAMKGMTIAGYTLKLPLLLED